MKFGMLLEVDE